MLHLTERHEHLHTGAPYFLREEEMTERTRRLKAPRTKNPVIITGTTTRLGPTSGSRTATPTATKG